MNFRASVKLRFVSVSVLVAVISTMIPFAVPAHLNAIEVDDEIPGAAIPASPLSGTVDALADPNDVYSLDLTAGQRLTLSLIGPEGGDLDLYLFGPATTALGYFIDAVGYSKRTTFPETISYLVPSSGSYRIAVHAFSGSGAYALSWHVAEPSSTVSAITFVSNRIPAYNVAVTITGSLRSGWSPLSGKTFALQRLSGSSWVTVAQQTSGSTGLASFSVVPYGYSLTVYRVVFAGALGYAPSASLPLVVKPKAYVRTPDGPSSITEGKPFWVWGYLRPRHLAGTYPIRVYKQKWNGSRWVSYGYVYGRAYNYYGYTKYYARVTFSSFGRWRVRAYHADAAHFPVYSGWLEYR